MRKRVNPIVTQVALIVEGTERPFTLLVRYHIVHNLAYATDYDPVLLLIEQLPLVAVMRDVGHRSLANALRFHRGLCDICRRIHHKQAVHLCSESDNFHEQLACALILHLSNHHFVRVALQRMTDWIVVCIKPMRITPSG